MDFDYTNFPGKFLDISKITRQNIIPLVTIITPFFNSGKYFEYTFNCVINQSFPWFEWIIVDDGSTNQKDINLLNQYQLKDSRIKIYKKANGGIASARNYAISKSSTDFIVPLDADDLISPVYLEINYWALNFNPSASWSYTDSVGFGDQQYLWKKNFNLEKLKVNN